MHLLGGRMRARNAILGLGLAAMLTACYTYRPSDGPVPALGSHVSLELNAEGTHDLARQLGPNPARVDGVLLGVDSIGPRLAVHDVENARGEQARWNGEQVRVPRQLIGAVEDRRLSMTQTGMIAGLAVGGLYAASRLLGGSGTLGGAAGGAPGSNNH
jgi:hypothetical protein